MKKIIVKLTLLICILCTSFTPIMANDSTEEMYTLVPIEEVELTNEETEYLEQQRIEMEKLGYTLQSREVYVCNNPNSRIDNLYNITRNPVKSNYVGTSKDYAKSQNKGMRYLLDVTYSFAVNALSAKLTFLSDVSAIFNVSPSDFMSIWYKGDVLSSRDTYVLLTDFYRGYDSYGMERTFFASEKTTATIYWELYTTLGDAPYKSSTSDTQVRMTKHYNDHYYCFAKAKEQRDSGRLYTIDDQY